MIRCLGLVVLAVALVSVSRGVHAAPIFYVATLNGPNEDPPTTSPGTGFAEVDFDPVTNLLHVNVTFSGLETPSTAAHIHSPTPAPLTGTAGVATVMPAFPGFPLGATSGSDDATLDMTQASSYNPAYVAMFPGSGQAQVLAAEADLARSLAAGTAYFNIHTTMFPGGAIRGFLTPAVPEPASLVMLGTGVLGIVAYGWRTAAQRRT
jgi:hypothetical protein